MKSLIGIKKNNNIEEKIERKDNGYEKLTKTLTKI